MRDLLMHFFAFPILKKSDGPIRNRLLAKGADATLLAVWEELVAQEQQEYDEDSEFN